MRQSTQKAFLNTSTMIIVWREDYETQIHTSMHVHAQLHIHSTCKQDMAHAIFEPWVKLKLSTSLAGMNVTKPKACS